MHNLSNEYSQNEFQQNQGEFELSPEFESDEREMETDELGYELLPEFENDEFESDELAQELMQISNEAEFFDWIKKAAKKVGGIASKFVNSPMGQQATAALGTIAKKTLPNIAGKAGAWLGGKAGGFVGQQALGQKFGQKLGTMAGNAAADRYPQFAKFATDVLGKLSNEFEAGTLTSVKPSIIKSASKHYPIILKIKGTVVGRQVNGQSQRPANQNQEAANYEIYGEAGDQEGTFNEMTEMELASELLSIQSEAELDQFFGGLLKKAVRGVSNFAKSGAGRALGGMLKNIAKKALPVAGGALGSLIAPGVGTAIGGSLGSAASNLFELELEGLSPEDREFEVSRAFVRFAGNAARRAARMKNMRPNQAARKSVISAARRYAPGLLIRRPRYYYSGGGFIPTGYLQPTYAQPSYNGATYTPPEETVDEPEEGDETTGETGTWHKQGNRIVLEGNF